MSDDGRKTFPLFLFCRDVAFYIGDRVRNNASFIVFKVVFQMCENIIYPTKKNSMWLAELLFIMKIYNPN